jgi:hypothetical protein
MFGLFFDCILTSHGYRVKVYPTYCKCYVFTPALCSFSEVVQLRYLILEIEGTDEAPSTMRTRVSLFEERYRGRTLIARAWRSIACLFSSVFTISIPERGITSLPLRAYQSLTSLKRICPGREASHLPHRIEAHKLLNFNPIHQAKSLNLAIVVAYLRTISIVHYEEGGVKFLTYSSFLSNSASSSTSPGASIILRVAYSPERVRSVWPMQ